MNYYKCLITNLILILFVLNVSANPFEGVIYFQKTEGDNVTYFKYYVKGDNVRIEDVKEGGKLNGILLIDMKTVSLKMLSCSSQLYIEVPLSPPAEKPQVKIEKTGEIKVINGEECELWKVVDAKEFSRYEYWVNQGDYSFFSPMLRILNRKDKIALAWVSLNVNDNYFPFEGTEYSSTGKVITRLKVIEIKEKVLDPELFNIPSNYSLFERRINN
jgi:hypothetical protein